MTAAGSETAEVGPVPGSRGPLHRRAAEVMGTVVSLALRGRHAGTATGEAAWSEAMARLRRAEAMFSTYRADSLVSRLERAELLLADCPPEVHTVLALADRAEQESGGAFAVRRLDATGVVRLDPSGVVKGWAADRAAAALAALDGTDFCLSVGGDLVCRTLDPASPPWRIGIEHPHDPTRLVATVPVRTGAVATSGTAHRGAHLVDARTGTAPAGVASVTVVGADLTSVDVDATAAYALGPEAARWLRTRPGRTGLVVWADGRPELVTGPTGRG
ncbi:thiamine biosynthesis lipoprotein [Friedmanniella luteola]|uniref:FAD:protein FMN transferase n=1 Tax=Friedmanniella luteola TaxID=546871 RepID=A0A1H1RFK1_9ACTN|nr:FAD:protein FMN transferase [Friedmanniella luteola]SDS33699.1 thiamine biosynthesis lipoprotein [Friedmanniella luteola]